MKDHSKVHAHSHGSHRDSSRNRSKSRGREGSASANEQSSKSRSKSKSKQSQSSKHAPQDDGRLNKSSSKQPNSKSTNKSPNGKTTKSKSAPSTNGNRSTAEEFKSKKRAQKFATQASKAIPASVRMISGSHDVQTSADVKNIGSSFALPDPAGRAGGACTAALLEVLYRYYDEGHDDDDASWVEVLREMRSVLQQRGYDQVPQLTSSRMIDVHDPFVITPSSFNPKKNTQRAVLIGINYVNQKGELSGCHNDVLNIAKYLREVQGFKKENITILMDDGHHKDPTKSEIMKAYKKVVKESQDGDVVFCHYSGELTGFYVVIGDEDDGYDETLIPVDYQKAGQIRDDDLLKVLVHPMRAGVTMTCLMDCCHSGTVLDLPYRFTADGDVEEMEMNEKVNFTDALWTTAGGLVAAAAASAVAAVTTPPPEMMILGGGPNAIHEYSDTGCCVVS
eukprot:CCRYP_011225-RC/>CCRYP_011225-RC protein AED:0.14 eAED:0.14 QI:0/0.5/0.33/1/0.5/0.33/3/368/449